MGSIPRVRGQEPAAIRNRALILGLVVFVQRAPIADDEPQKRVRSFAGLGQGLKRSGRADNLSEREPRDSHGRSRKPANLAVARNCGIGSSCLNAEVNAFERLHIVRGWNSSWRGKFPPIWTKGEVDVENRDVFFVASPLSKIISSLHCL
jgi:hypothetical protein